MSGESGAVVRSCDPIEGYGFIKRRRKHWQRREVKKGFGLRNAWRAIDRKRRPPGDHVKRHQDRRYLYGNLDRSRRGLRNLVRKELRSFSLKSFSRIVAK